MSERDKYKTEFNAWSKKTAQSTLEMCRVVYEAKRELESQDFLKFCNEIGRKGEDATARKFLKIGEKYDQFYQYAELLPNSWKSIHSELSDLLDSILI
jgi:predicted Zn-dependent protease with MMP-like domain